MLDPELLDMLQEQMNVERGNHALYHAMSLALDAERWPGSATYMAKAAIEELAHADQFAQHIIKRCGLSGSRPVFDDLPAPEVPTGPRLEAYFLAAYQAEQVNTGRLLLLMDKAEALGDRQTCTFLIPLIDEQTEAESELADILTEISRNGDDKAALLVLDRELGK